MTLLCLACMATAASPEIMPNEAITIVDGNAVCLDHVDYFVQMKRAAYELAGEKSRHPSNRRYR